MLCILLNFTSKELARYVYDKCQWPGDARLLGIYNYIIECLGVLGYSWPFTRKFTLSYHGTCRDHFGYGFGQRGKALHGNTSSNWLNPYPEWSMHLTWEGHDGCLSNPIWIAHLDQCKPMFSFRMLRLTTTFGRFLLTRPNITTCYI